MALQNAISGNHNKIIKLLLPLTKLNLRVYRGLILKLIENQNTEILKILFDEYKIDPSMMNNDLLEWTEKIGKRGPLIKVLKLLIGYKQVVNKLEGKEKNLEYYQNLIKEEEKKQKEKEKEESEPETSKSYNLNTGLNALDHYKKMYSNYINMKLNLESRKTTEYDQLRNKVNSNDMKYFVRMYPEDFPEFSL